MAKNQSTLSNIYCRVPNACYGNSKKSSKPMVPGISPAKAMDEMHNGIPGVQQSDFEQFGNKTKSSGKYGGLDDGSGVKRDTQEIASDKDVVASSNPYGGVAKMDMKNLATQELLQENKGDIGDQMAAKYKTPALKKGCKKKRY